MVYVKNNKKENKISDFGFDSNVIFMSDFNQLNL